MMITAIWRKIAAQAAEMTEHLWRAQFVRPSWEHAPPAQCMRTCAPTQWWRDDKIGTIDHDIGKAVLRDLDAL